MLEALRQASFLLLLASNAAFATPSKDAGESGTATAAAAGTTSLAATASKSRLSADLHRPSNSTCVSGTINYITHTLRQQCLRTDRIHINSMQTENTTVGTSTQDAAQPLDTSHTNATSELLAKHVTGITTSTAFDVAPVSTATGSTGSIQTLVSTVAAVEGESTFSSSTTGEEESLFDSAAFLSFEEWKKQNLAKTGQSPENFGQERLQSGERQRPGINNALDTLGEDSEIDLDFAGFGNAAVAASSRDVSNPRAAPSTDDAGTLATGQAAPTTAKLRSKDAGKTCKERTNYASFDCAATMMKQNPECKHASSILVENKDSYMLNICSAKNKYLIVELCNDIHIDTIVLANYEFFSSIFRHFRVSVSDRYPVKSDKWKELGTFEARNTREVQAFLVEEPQIWARYLRIEFLDHYGSEYYCPVSLLRVHGRTMMQEFRQEEEIARGELVDEEPTLDAAAVASVEPQEPMTATIEPEKATVQAIAPLETSTVDASKVTTSKANTSQSTTPTIVWPAAKSTTTDPSVAPLVAPSSEDLTCPPSHTPKSVPASAPKNVSLPLEALEDENQTSLPGSSDTLASSTSPAVIPAVSTQSHSAPSHDDELSLNTSAPITNATAQIPSSKLPTSAPVLALDPAATARDLTSSMATLQSGVVSSTPSNSTRSTYTSSQLPQASSQESFFKSISKRLHQLESNSTLSLQYIEEQSRILRDAFNKVEKRQIAATTTFLSQLNDTVMTELHGFRQAYDQLWQGTVIELDGQREQYQREMLALSSRLTMVADELVWQKRMGIMQSTLLLMCLGLVLFARQGNTGYVEMTLAQQLMSRSQAAIRAGWESDPNSPSSPMSRSPISVFRRRLWRSSTEPPNGTLGEEEDTRPHAPDEAINAPLELLDTGERDEDDGEENDNGSEGASDWQSRTQSSPPAPDRGQKLDHERHADNIG